MAKVKLNNFSNNKDFSRLLKANSVLYDKRQNYFAKKYRRSLKTINSRVNNPETMQIDELRTFIKELHLTQDAVIEFIGAWPE